MRIATRGMGSAAALLLLASTAMAQPARHHEGVQVRLAGGGLWLEGWQRTEAGSVRSRGAATAVSLALGESLEQDLALNMDVLLARAPNASHGILDDTVLTTIHLGVGITYWFMPSNIYLGASIGLARSAVEAGTIRIGVEIPNLEPTQLGFGLHGTLGKQWWVGRNWGLGLALDLLGSVARADAGGEKRPRWLLGVGLSAVISYR